MPGLEGLRGKSESESVMANDSMPLSEAKRRFEKVLAVRGYSTKQSWGWRPRGGKTPGTQYYMLTLAATVEGLRALLWADEDDKWYGSLSLKVGDEGEMLITGGRITRTLSQSWAPHPFKKFLPTIEQHRTLLLKWDLTPIGERGTEVLVYLAYWFSENEQPSKANAILRGLERGEISEATISEALSIVQYRWARSRTDRMRTSLIWREFFE